MVNRWFTDRQKTQGTKQMPVFTVCQTVRAKIKTNTTLVSVILEVRTVQVIWLHQMLDIKDIWAIQAILGLPLWILVVHNQGNFMEQEAKKVLMVIWQMDHLVGKWINHNNSETTNKLQWAKLEWASKKEFKTKAIKKLLAKLINNSNKQDQKEHLVLWVVLLEGIMELW